MKKYDSYAHSGIAWVGDTPKHWKRTKMKYLFDQIIGGAWGDEASGNENDLICLRIADFDYASGRFKSSNEFTIRNLVPNESSKRILQKNDLVIEKSGGGEKTPVGRVVLFDKEFKAVSSNFTNRLVPSKCHNSNYLLYIFKSMYERGLTFKHINQSTGIQNLNTSSLLSEHCCVPGFAEQNVVANFLDHKTSQLNALISKKEKLIELLQEERTAIINHAVTKGLNPDAPMRDSGIEWLGEIPAHWEVKRIKHVSNKIGSGVTPKGGAEVYQDSGIPLLRSQNVYFDGFHLDDVAFISDEIHQSMSGSKVYPLDVLINITGGSIGRCYYVSGEFTEANVNQHVCIVRPNAKIETIYLCNTLRSIIGQIQIQFCQIGGNRESLNFEQLKNFFLPLPSIEEQKEILKKITKHESEINNLIKITTQEINLLNEYKTALISEVVTGKVDVRGETLDGYGL